jgi:hypothetical protein
MDEGSSGSAFGYNFALPAGVAQLVEQRIRNAKVEGSTPSTGTTLFPQPKTALASGRR